MRRAGERPPPPTTSVSLPPLLPSNNGSNAPRRAHRSHTPRNGASARLRYRERAASSLALLIAGQLSMAVVRPGSSSEGPLPRRRDGGSCKSHFQAGQQSPRPQTRQVCPPILFVFGPTLNDANRSLCVDDVSAMEHELGEFSRVITLCSETVNEVWIGYSVGFSLFSLLQPLERT